MQPVKIEHLAIISGGGLGDTPWKIKTQRIDDLDFFTVEKKCCGLARFVGRTAKGNQLRGFKFFDRLRAMRNSLQKAALLRQQQGLHNVTACHEVRPYNGQHYHNNA